jgi:hypothetical protein
LEEGETDFPARRVEVGSMTKGIVLFPARIRLATAMSSVKRLAPGFRHVEAFDSDDIYECDEQGEVIEEVSYVTLDLGAVEPTLVPSSSTYRLIVRGHILCSLF